MNLKAQRNGWTGLWSFTYGCIHHNHHAAIAASVFKEHRQFEGNMQAQIAQYAQVGT